MRLIKEKAPFLEYENNYIYKISNDKIDIELMTFGATILCIKTPDISGKKENIVLRFKDINNYAQPGYPTFGSTMCPNAGKIAGGILKIEDKVYQLSKNTGNDNMHGGVNNGAKRLWEEDFTEATDNFVKVSMKTSFVDGLEGYTGNRNIKVIYTLFKDDVLRIEFEGITDKDTYLNMTNHSVFNLSGDYSSVYEHQLLLDCDKYLYNGENNMPLEIRDVTNTPYNFLNVNSIKSNIEKFENEQVKKANGFNNAFVLKENRDIKQNALILKDNKSKRKVEIKTDFPSIVLYTGGTYNEKTVLENDLLGEPYRGIAIEPQRIPNEMNIKGSNYKYLKSTEKFSHFIEYRFSVEK